MRLLAAVYGFQITRPIQIGKLAIQRISTEFDTARNLAKDLQAYNLTATVVGEALPDELRFNLEDAMCFAEHLDVIVFPANQLSESETPSLAEMPKTLRIQHRNSGGGEIIGEDSFFPGSRQEFLIRAMEKLEDKAFCDSTNFKSLLFKCIEVFRQRRPFLDITYYLLFSGLESYARASLGDFSNHASVPICKLLRNYLIRHKAQPAP